MFYSPETGFFYNSGIHNDIPSDVLEVTPSEFQTLSVGRAGGKQIALQQGRLVLVDRDVTEEELHARERAWRDTALADAQWLRDRHRDEVEIGGSTSLTAERYADVLAYLQALREWPQSEQFPSILHRPSPPVWLADA